MAGWINIECFKDCVNICPIDSPGFLNIWPFILGSIWNDLKAYLTIEHSHTSLKRRKQKSAFSSIVKFKTLYSAGNRILPKSEELRLYWKNSEGLRWKAQGELWFLGLGAQIAGVPAPHYSAPLVGRFLDLEISFLSKMLKITVLFAKMIYRPRKNNHLINSR